MQTPFSFLQTVTFVHLKTALSFLVMLLLGWAKGLRQGILQKSEVAGAAFWLATDNAIADSGAAKIFMMDGNLVVNKQPMTWPLKVSLADGRQVMSTHMCDIHIKGLPFVLTGHIILDLPIEAGWDITFTHDQCIVWYKNNIIDATTTSSKQNIFFYHINLYFNIKFRIRISCLLLYWSPYMYVSVIDIFLTTFLNV